MSNRETDRGLPPLDWLRVFEAAGRHGSFTAAAEEFGSTQAAVSQRIRNLENWLGRKLFVRAARGVSLTVEGESYLPLVQEALTALKLGTEDLFSAAPRELRIAALDSHLNWLLLPRIAGFLETRPDVRLVTDSVPKRSDFAEEKTAFQIRFGRGKWAGRSARLLHREVLLPMASPDLAGPWQDLPVIDLRGERPGWRDWAQQAGQPRPDGTRYSLDSMGHGLQAAALGQGVVLGSVVLGAPLLASGRLAACTSGQLETGLGYWLTWPEGYAERGKRKALADTLTEALRVQL